MNHFISLLIDRALITYFKSFLMRREDRNMWVTLDHYIQWTRVREVNHQHCTGPVSEQHVYCNSSKWDVLYAAYCTAGGFNTLEICERDFCGSSMHVGLQYDVPPCTFVGLTSTCSHVHILLKRLFCVCVLVWKIIWYIGVICRFHNVIKCYL